MMNGVKAQNCRRAVTLWHMNMNIFGICCLEQIFESTSSLFLKSQSLIEMCWIQQAFFRLLIIGLLV